MNRRFGFPQYLISLFHSLTLSLERTKFGGNPVSMAISNVVLSVIEDEGLQSNAKELGDHLKDGLEGLKEKHSCIGDVRGMGLFIGVDLVKDCESCEPDRDLAERFVKRSVKS